MSRAGPSWLLVRAGGRLVGLALTQVVEVLPPGTVYPVPSAEPAVLGVGRVRGRLVPVVHLGTLLDGGSPAGRGEAAVLVEMDGRQVCLEVDEAGEVLTGRGMPVPDDSVLPWASAVARHEGRLVPLLDLAALGARIRETA